MSCFAGTAFPHTITQAPLAAPRSGYGDKTFGAQTTFAALHSKERRRLILADNNEVAISDVITTLENVVLSSLIWLPDDNTADPSAGRRIQGINSFPEVEGNFTMYEILL